MLGPQVKELRPFPWQPKRARFSREGSDLGVPARVFPQWLRCTGCDRLAPLSAFEYRNTHPFRPDLAVFEHVPCYRPRRTVAARRRRGSPVRAGPLPVGLCTTGTSTSSPTSCGCTAGSRARRAPTCRC